MAVFSRVNTFHDMYLAVYRPSGALCAVGSDRLDDTFGLVLMYEDDALPAGTGVLLAESADAGFFIRPYPFRNWGIPLRLGPSREPERITLQHPGSRFLLCAEPTTPVQHFGAVGANRETIGGWEAFKLEPVKSHLVPGRIRIQAGLLLDFATPGCDIVDLYSRLSCDALAARADLPPLDRIMSSFESLGDNCEFGFAQRQCHAEPLGMLRFAGGLGVNGLAAALRRRFAGLGQAYKMVCVPHPHIEHDYDVFESIYGIGYHTVRAAKTEPATIVAEEAVKLVYLRDKLFEDFEDAEKIFVFKANESPPDADILNLLSAMHEYGRPTLLSVVLSDLDHPPGTVIKLADGLLRGFIDRFAPYDAAWDAPAPSWIRICRNAYALARA